MIKHGYGVFTIRLGDRYVVINKKLQIVTEEFSTRKEAQKVCKEFREGYKKNKKGGTE